MPKVIICNRSIRKGRTFAAILVLLLSSCTFHEYAGELSIKGCISATAATPVVYSLQAYGGGIPEKVDFQYFDSLDKNNCIDSYVMWKSGGKTTFFGIPIMWSNPHELETFGLLLHGGNRTLAYNLETKKYCKNVHCKSEIRYSFRIKSS